MGIYSNIILQLQADKSCTGSGVKGLFMQHLLLGQYWKDWQAIYQQIPLFVHSQYDIYARHFPA